MRRRRKLPAEPRPEVRAAAVAFLRDWLPAQARASYRALIAADPDGWTRHPHFAGGIVVRHLLRGNGLDETALGVRDLEPIWPALLRDAVADVPTGVEHAGDADDEPGLSG